jgi:hypothetical protein
VPFVGIWFGVPPPPPAGIVTVLIDALEADDTDTVLFTARRSTNAATLVATSVLKYEPTVVNVATAADDTESVSSVTFVVAMLATPADETARILRGCFTTAATPGDAAARIAFTWRVTEGTAVLVDARIALA